MLMEERTLNLLALCLAAVLTPDGADGYVCKPSYELDETVRFPIEPYRPEPGDIYMSTTATLWSRVGHKLAGSGAPHHSGIVFRRPDGSPAILESGPFNTLRVKCLDLMDDLGRHVERNEIVWIRKRRTPLTAEQSACLTQWAQEQDGKRFAWVRLLTQLTPFRCRGYYRTDYFGAPNGARSSYYCAELVMESLVHVGALDRDKTRPSATYPHDIFTDSSPIPFINRNQNLSAGWYPPTRWLKDNPEQSR
jgi:hypothetical protein